MSKPTHTPGPWNTGDHYWRTIVGSVTRKSERGLLVAVAEIPHSENEAEDLANARLIAAAPDNYEANRLSLRNVEAMLYRLPISADATERASLEAWAATLRAAIAKATDPDVSIPPPEPPTIHVTLHDAAGKVKVHVPRSLGAKVEFLDCDEPDWPGLKMRGIPHPTEESAALERDPAVETFEENL